MELGGGDEAFSRLAEGEAGQDAGEGNSFIVTVTRLVVTSVTTTSLQLGAISGCQSGSPSAGTLCGSTGAALWSPGVAEGLVVAVGGWRLAWRWRALFWPPSGGAEWSAPPSSSSSTEEAEGEEGRKEEVVASEDRTGAGGLVLWTFFGSV